MSKGNPRVVVRFAPEQLAAIREQVAKLNNTSAASPPDLSEFIRRAVQEKLDHYARSRKPRSRRGVSDTRRPSLSPGQGGRPC